MYRVKLILNNNCINTCYCFTQKEVEILIHNYNTLCCLYPEYELKIERLTRHWLKFYWEPAWIVTKVEKFDNERL